jgi:transposase
MLIEKMDFKVYLCLERVDMRKAINGLSILVKENMDLDPFSGHLFVFCGKNKKTLKILYWDKNGFALWYKRLEEDKFRWPTDPQTVLELSREEFSWLLKGLDFRSAYKERRYSILN